MSRPSAKFSGNGRNETGRKGGVITVHAREFALHPRPRRTHSLRIHQSRHPAPLSTHVGEHSSCVQVMRRWKLSSHRSLWECFGFVAIPPPPLHLRLVRPRSPTCPWPAAEARAHNLQHLLLCCPRWARWERSTACTSSTADHRIRSSRSPPTVHCRRSTFLF